MPMIAEMQDLLCNSMFEFNRSTLCFARYGPVENMKWLIEQGCELNRDVFNGAVMSGKLDNMEFLFDKKCPFDESTFELAASTGNLVTMQLLYKMLCPFDANTFNAAAKTNILENLVWLKEIHCPSDDRAFYNVCINGTLDNMKWAMKNINRKVKVWGQIAENRELMSYEKKRSTQIMYSNIFKAIALSGNVESMKWFHKNVYNLVSSTEIFANAALSGNLELMKWMREKEGFFLWNSKPRFPWNANTFTNAIKNGNIDNMNWLASQECEWNNESLIEAIRNEKKDIVEWMIHNDCEFDDNTMNEAMKTCNLDIINLLESSGCPWNETTFVRAKHYGLLDDLKWMRLEFIQKPKTIEYTAKIQETAFVCNFISGELAKNKRKSLLNPMDDENNQNHKRLKTIFYL
jgi:hypothetical protein